MGVGLGKHVVFATGVQSVFDTSVTPDKFYEILDEDIQYQKNRLSSQGRAYLGAGRNPPRGSRSIISTIGAAGPASMELSKTNMDRWFQHLLGGTSTVAQQGATTAYLHTHTLGSLNGKFLTVQKQIRDEAGTVVTPFTTIGTKVLSGEFTVETGSIPTLNLQLDAREMVTSVAAASPSYPSISNWSFKDASVKLAGTSASLVRSAGVTISNVADTERHHLGSSGKKAEQASFAATIEGNLSVEFDAAATVYDRFVADTPIAFALEFVGAVIEGAHSERLTINVPEIRFTGSTPSVSDDGLIVMEGPFEGFYDGSSAAVNIQVMSTDTTN